MISWIEEESGLPAFAETPFTCRILATARAYGMKHPFARFWKQDCRALLCLLDGVFLVEALQSADFGELREFVSICGARRVLCGEQTAQRLRLPAASGGKILLCPAVQAPPPVPFSRDPSPRELHAFLLQCQTNAFRAPEFEPFYLDLSHRTRHGQAVSAGLYDGRGVLAACCVCTAFSESMALLSAVAVRPELRRGGWGSRAVRALASLLPGRKLAVFCEPGENETFYRTLGFTGSGEFRELYGSQRRAD